MPFLVNGQKKKENVGVKFEHKTSNWDSIVAKAKRENKYIFIDCYTTWCGPCKEVAKNIFPLKEVGHFFNKNCINISLQIDKTKKDNAQIIASRNIVKQVEKITKINAYPSFLIFDNTGTLVHKFTGSDADELIRKAKDGFDKNEQYYTLIEKYSAGDREENFLKKLCKKADDAEDNVDEYLKAFIDTRENLYTKENGEFIIGFIEESKGLAFENLYANKDQWYIALGKTKSNETIERAVYSEIETMLLFKTDSINWDKISKHYAEKYPDYGNIAVAKALMNYKVRNNDSKGYLKILDSLFVAYPVEMNYPDELNSNAMVIFEIATNTPLLNKALTWSKRSIEQDENPMYIDTYANLLYKLGQKNEAIKQEEKAISLLKEEDKKSYIETLEKMKKGEKTWK